MFGVDVWSFLVHMLVFLRHISHLKLLSEDVLAVDFIDKE